MVRIHHLPPNKSNSLLRIALIFFVDGFDRSGVRKQSSAPAVGDSRTKCFALLLKSNARVGDERVKRAYPAPAVGDSRTKCFALLLKSDTRAEDEKIKRA